MKLTVLGGGGFRVPYVYQALLRDQGSPRIDDVWLYDTDPARLKAMAQTSDGFEIARRDLEIRGPGEFLGARQSGAPLLRFADLAMDAELLDWARQLAPLMLDRHPELARRHTARWLGGKSDYLKA